MERVGELVYCFLKHQGHRIDKLQMYVLFHLYLFFEHVNLPQIT
jgi:hypothetical protein